MLDTQMVRGLPRKAKRRIWRQWWKHQREEMKGSNRLEQRQYWRNIWNQLRTPNHA